MSDLTTVEIQEIMASLNRVNDATHKMIMGMANGMSKMEIVTLFNQTALDFFTTVINIMRTLGKDEEREIEGYMSLFQTALKYNVILPIDTCASIILRVAPEIYTENEKFFLQLHIPNAKVKSKTGGFNIIESDKFKRLWTEGSTENKEKVKEKLISLTTWCHAYFFKLII